ncbi:MAG: hypothetical protein VW491_03135 [Gammaproteobacteria bacterium]
MAEADNGGSLVPAAANTWALVVRHVERGKKHAADSQEKNKAGKRAVAGNGGANSSPGLAVDQVWLILQKTTLFDMSGQIFVRDPQPSSSQVLKEGGLQFLALLESRTANEIMEVLAVQECGSEKAYEATHGFQPQESAGSEDANATDNLFVSLNRSLVESGSVFIDKNGELVQSTSTAAHHKAAQIKFTLLSGISLAENYKKEQNAAEHSKDAAHKFFVRHFYKLSDRLPDTLDNISINDRSAETFKAACDDICDLFKTRLGRLIIKRAMRSVWEKYTGDEDENIGMRIDKGATADNVAVCMLLELIKQRHNERFGAYFQLAMTTRLVPFKSQNDLRSVSARVHVGNDGCLHVRCTGVQKMSSSENTLILRWPVIVSTVRYYDPTKQPTKRRRVYGMRNAAEPFA